MKYKKASPLFLAFVLLMLCVLTFMMFVTISAKYVQKTENSVLYLSVFPLTYDCILDKDTDVHEAIYNATNVPVADKDDANARMNGSDILAEIEILYFSSYERASYFDGRDTVTVPKTGSDFSWSDGIDVGLTVASVRFFYDSDAKTGYIISRRAEEGASPNIIQANELSARLFSPSLDTVTNTSWKMLREVYFLDYGGIFDVENPAQVPA